MCLACSRSIDAARQDAFGGRITDMLNGGMTLLMVSLGHRAGLFDAMADGQPVTSEVLAGRTGFHERPVREWLHGMVAARIVERDPEQQTHRLPAEHVAWLTRTPAAGANLAVYAQYLAAVGQAEDLVLESFRNGSGVPYAAFPRFHDVMAEDSAQGSVAILLERIVPLVSGLHDRLVVGIDVLDVGCGRGRAMMRLAEAYPASRFTGIDLDSTIIEAAAREAQGRGLANLRFEAHDLTHWRSAPRYDWITAFDAIHDQARPDLVLSAICGALRPGGVFLMQDINASSEPVENIEHPLGALLYAISCFHCMQVSLAQGGMGLGTCWGIQLACSMLVEAGFEEPEVHRLEEDVQNAYFVTQPRAR